MSDLKIQETIPSLETINLSGLNGFSGDDLITLTPVSLPTLTTAQLGSLSPTISVGAVGQGGAGYTLASGTSGSINWQSPNVWTTTSTASAIGSPMTVNQGGKIELRGEDADININGKSMSDWMAKVEERLNILTPNPELEKDWDDLRKLGERYRKLEKKCKEKAETWKKLKAMPPPSLD